MLGRFGGPVENFMPGKEHNSMKVKSQFNLSFCLEDGVQDTIFVSGLPDDVNEGDLESHFGSIGVIKVR